MESTLNALSTSIIADMIRFILSWLGQLSPVEWGMLLCGIVIVWFIKMAMTR